MGSEGLPVDFDALPHHHIYTYIYMHVYICIYRVHHLIRLIPPGKCVVFGLPVDGDALPHTPPGICVLSQEWDQKGYQLIVMRYLIGIGDDLLIPPRYVCSISGVGSEGLPVDCDALPHRDWGRPCADAVPPAAYLKVRLIL